MDAITIFFIVILYSFIQSISGVGILLFGTPTLLLLDYSFINALWILLPVSCALSITQIVTSIKEIDSHKEVYLFTLPALVISLMIVISFDYLLNIKALIGLMLIVISITRFSNLSLDRFDKAIRKNKTLGYVLIGITHGFTNLGGAPLSVIVSSIHSKNTKITTNIAFCYFILALSQLIILSLFQREFFDYKYLVLIPFVISNFLLLKRYLIKDLNTKFFKLFMNIIILMFGIACII